MSLFEAVARQTTITFKIIEVYNMEDYVLALLMLIFVVMVLKVTASESKYMPLEISQSYVSFWNPGYDIIDSGGGITMVTATGTAGTSSASSAKAYSGNSGDNLLPRRDLNWYAWGVGDGSSSAQAATINVVDSVGSTVAINPNYVWGIRKELRIGGGGPVWYLLNNWGDNTGVPVLITPNGANEGGVAPSGTLYNPDIIDRFIDTDTYTYAIPNFVILKKSVKNPVAQCALNSTASGNLCICDPGWYGTGDDSSKGGNPLGCNVCTPGYWCGGQSNGTGTPPEKGQWTACPVNANYSVAGSVQAAACGLKCVSQAGGVPSTAGGTWGVTGIVLTQTADVCYCNPGYEFAVVNDPGGGQRAGKPGVPGGAYKVNQCKACGATGSYGNWSPGGGYYQTNSTSAATPCTACPYGQYKHSGQLTGDNSSLQYDKTVACAGCPVGSSTNAPPSGADNCITCVGGTANNSTNQTSCPQCNAGSYSPSAGGALTCTQCQPGNYQSSPAQVSCIQCSKGSLAASPAATGCTQCPDGYWSPAGASTCKPWAGSDSLGRYLGSSGICPVGTQGIAGGSCSTCAVGSYNGTQGGTCANFCTKNTSSPAGASACTQCPAGQSTNGAAGLGVSCSPCPGGYYSNQGGDCVACGPGYVITPGTPATNSGACMGCGADTYSAATTCSPCPAGTTSPAGSSACTPFASPSLAWQFEGNTTDSITGLTGTTTGTVSYNSSGKYGQSLVITNTNGLGPAAINYIRYSTITFTTAFTSAVWVKFNTVDYGSHQYFLEFSGGPGGGIRYVVSLNSYNNITCRINDASNNTQTGVSSAVVAVGQWCHIVVVLDGTNQMIYVNGALSSSISCNTTGLTYLNPTLGGHPGITNYGRKLVNGELDDLRIYNTAVTPTQIQKIYQSGGNLYGALPAPALAFQFEGNTTDSITGLTGAARLDTSTPTAGTVSYAPGKYGQSLQITNAQTAPFQSGNNFVYWTISSIDKTTTSVSVSFWLNLNSLITTPQQTILVMPGSDKTDGDIRFELLSGGMRFGSGAGGGTYTSVVPIQSSVWNHFCGVYSTSGTVTLYTNGVASTTGTSSVIVTGTLYGISLGRYITAGGGGYGYTPFNGLVDDLRIYNTALSATQTQAIYQSDGRLYT